ncbi:ABC transporter permease [Cellulomonas rhizosphaerae]|uniref:ABC transporter permease n=1 Tax=Cellulomonas rhizosphaerae TaxID=2293719 RepID=A0A413RJ48_9CELL|nr:FtsX-like permease family protein [Cellulomonas rhizosphaerae]RHA38519.1 ABC transporter permease [Cellulomonas rhizosphaerae]
MLRLTLAQMRRSLGRLAAAGIAIAIGTAFVTATLIAGNVFSDTTRNALTARFGDADLVVVDARATAEQLAAARATSGVASASTLVTGYVQIGGNQRGEYLKMIGQASDPAFDTLDATSGALAKNGEIALPETTAKRLGVGVGDTVQVTYVPAGATVEKVDQVTVSGIVDDPAGAWTEYGGAGSATAGDLERWNGAPLESNTILIRTDDPTATRDRLASTLPAGGEVLTKKDAADQAMGQLSDSNVNFVVMLVLGFGAVALLVAGLVIANTFQVLVAQRTRTLALLRCVGARRSQLRASVLLEASLLGISASVIGVVAGATLAQATLWALDGTNTGAGRLPTTITVSAVTILVPLVVGALVTVASSLVPARAATRVAPIAALRPADAPTVRSTAGTVRLVLSLVMAIGGLLGLLLSVAAAHLSPMLGLGLGVMAGAVSFVGVLVGAVFWVPRVVGRVGGLLARSGSSTRLAVANSVRNPRRTAATSTALLIGVTLVSLMSTGAASARSSLASGLDQQFPVDMVLTSTTGIEGQGIAALPATTMQQVRSVDGVADAIELRAASLQSDAGYYFDVVAIDPARAADILRDSSTVDHLDDGTLVTGTLEGEGAGTHAFHAIEGASAAGTSDRSLTVVGARGLGQTSLVTPATIAELAPSSVTTTIWVRFDKDADPATVLNDVREVVDPDIAVQSAGAERRSYEQTIDALLAIVVGLLGVAVLIALIGVANTLSLSVLERRRESATLRAIGLSKRQLRISLGVEGMLIAGVGALLGVLLGLVYGWAGSAIIFGAFGDLRLAVAWRDLAIVLVVAVAAGLVASVLPARRAARTSPVAALGVE